LNILDSITRIEDLDPKLLGLNVGLEVHRQIKGTKLFCGCISELSEDVRGTFERSLSSKSSELGTYDPAAMFEERDKRNFRYQVTGNTCLVEFDEEPPHGPTDEIIDRAVSTALAFDCHIVPEVIFMRKIVLDGSNTSGFQRTAIIGLGGSFDIDDMKIGISSICLEEDSARRVQTEDDSRVFRLDRLGIPEIEITTEPITANPDVLKRAASKIGRILRSAGFYRRGIGTIRQDVNVSIAGGNRVEIKLVQDISSITSLIWNEVLRQLLLIEIADELGKRGFEPNDSVGEPVDLRSVFHGTSCKFIQRRMKAEDRVFGIRLKGFRYLFGTRSNDGYLNSKNIETHFRPGIDGIRRLGPDISGHLKAFTGLGGILDSDELPGYGITEKEVSDIELALGIEKEMDGFVVICSPEELYDAAYDVIRSRALDSFIGPPAEVRRIVGECRTEFMRPLPGAARMYPETDLPPIFLTDERIEVLKKNIPSDPIDTIGDLSTRTDVSRELLGQLLDGGLLRTFNDSIARGIVPKIAARVLSSLHGKDIEFDDGPEGTPSFLFRIMEAAQKGMIVKERIDQTVDDAYAQFRNGADMDIVMKDLLRNDDQAPMEDLVSFVESTVKERRDFIIKNKDRSIDPLMGIVMKRFRGRIDGSQIRELLVQHIQKVVDGG